MKPHPFVLAGALLAASVASAQTPYIYCAPGASSCFAMKTQFLPHYELGQVFGTDFTVWLQNLEGSYTAPTWPFATSFALSTVAITRNNGPAEPPNGLPDLFLQVGNDVGITAEGNAQTGLAGAINRFGNATEEITDERFLLDLMGVAGCTVPTFDDVPIEMFFMVRTCPSQGLNGWARMDFWLGLRDGFDLSAPPIGVDADMFLLAVGGPFGDNLCLSGGEQSGFGDTIYRCPALPYVLPSVAPEPASVALLATGLVGIVGWRRRRVA